MANYSTLLKTWGDTGSAYPDGYSYLEGEQPVDAWDNFLIYNVVSDLDSLINLTNARIESEYGASTGHPASPEDGHQYWETTNDQLEVYDSTAAAWKDLAYGQDLRAHENIGSGNPHSVGLEEARTHNNVLAGAVDFGGQTLDNLGELQFSDADADGYEWRVTGGGLDGDLQFLTYDATNGLVERASLSDAGDASLTGGLTVAGDTTLNGANMNVGTTTIVGANANTIDFGGASGHVTIDADVRIADHVHWESDRAAFFGGLHNFSVRYAAAGDELLIQDEQAGNRVASFPKSSPAIFDNGLHSDKGAEIHSDIVQGHNPAGTITETTSPTSWNFGGSEHRDFHTQTDVTLSNGSAGSVTENVTVDLYDGVDTTGVLVDSETQSVTIAAGASSTVSFLVLDHNIDNGNYHIEVTTSGTTLAVDSSTEYTKGAQYTLGQDATGNLELAEEDGSLLLEMDTETLAFDFKNQPSFGGNALATESWASSTFVDAAGDTMSGNLTLDFGDEGLKIASHETNNRVFLAPKAADGTWDWGREISFDYDVGEWDIEGSPMAGGSKIATEAGFNITGDGAGGKVGTNMLIEDGKPQIETHETGLAAGAFGTRYWWHHNGGNLYLLVDRNDDGSWESPHPLRINSNNERIELMGSTEAHPDFFRPPTSISDPTGAPSGAMWYRSDLD